MRIVGYFPYLLFGGLMILHGIAHLPAVLGSWNLATFDDVSRQPNIWLTSAGDGLLIVFGVVWLLAAVSFVIAGIGLMLRAFWWPFSASLAIVLSLPMTLLWREDAVVGLVLNAFILVGIASFFLIAPNRRQQAA